MNVYDKFTIFHTGSLVGKCRTIRTRWLDSLLLVGIQTWGCVGGVSLSSLLSISRYLYSGMRVGN